MSALTSFYAGNAAQTQNEFFVVSDRFQDEQGKPIPWEIRSLSAAEEEACRKAATRRVKTKGQGAVTETNSEEYLAKLAVECVVHPNLKDAGLQQSYGVLGAESLLRKMLLSGEYMGLIHKVTEINGFDRETEDMIEEVKN